MVVALGVQGHGRAWRWGALAMALLILLAVLGIGAVSYLAADRLVHPPRDNDPRTPADFGMSHERVAFASEDGTPLVGWWIPRDDALGTVVFVHGYGASKAQGLSVASFLHEGGYQVLAFDLRAHGESGGTHTTFGIEEAKDVRAALRYLAARGDVDTTRVALFGWSMGAASVLQAGPDVPEVRAFIADSGFARLGSVVSNSWEMISGLPRFPFGPVTIALASAMTGRDMGESEPARATHELGRPLLIIQGMQDPLVKPEEGEALRDAAGEGAELWLVPGTDHVNARRFHPTEYEERVLHFLDVHVASAPSPAEDSSSLSVEHPAWQDASASPIEGLCSACSSSSASSPLASAT